MEFTIENDSVRNSAGKWVKLYLTFSSFYGWLDWLGLILIVAVPIFFTGLPNERLLFNWSAAIIVREVACPALFEMSVK